MFIVFFFPRPMLVISKHIFNAASFSSQWTSRAILRGSDRADVWIPTLARSHLQRPETRESSHRPPRLHPGQPPLCHFFLSPGTSFPTVCPSLFPGDRLWICQASKRENLDVVWNTGVPGSWNHPQQSKYFFNCPDVYRAQICFYFNLKPNFRKYDFFLLLTCCLVCLSPPKYLIQSH